MSKGRFIDVGERAIVSLTGPESLDLLQRISTNDVIKLTGSGTVQTVLTNEKGRIVEVVSLVNAKSGSLLLIGQSNDPLIIKEWIEKYIIMEDIKAEALSGQFNHLILYDVNQQMVDLSPASIPSEYQVFDEQLSSTKLVHAVAPRKDSRSATTWLKDAGFEAGDEYDFEEFRVMNGIPRFPDELSSLYNPLEAGLQHLVSFTKGCYIGQEVIARLDTYKKVQRRLARLNMLEKPESLPELIYSGGVEIGSITSAVRVRNSDEFRGLGYVKTGSDASNGRIYFRKDGKEVELTVETTGVEGM
jgi:folate-binding protein YgfZ